MRRVAQAVLDPVARIEVQIREHNKEIIL